ncbi:DUF4097 family beta strand repeat-containing protein [Nonomuraea sp. NPDC048826]|uniref:DUF4097 family beta strand repeat-containing protein n=1 Tax=Nonomuraea sp. NPDC048826 TaxID=3364347 RepID=UPI00371C8F24
MRRHWLILGTAMTVIALVISANVVWEIFVDPSPPSETTWRSVPFRGGTLTIEAGDDIHVHIQAGPAGSVGIARDLVWTERKPTVSEEWAGDALRLDGGCPGDRLPDRPDCVINYQLYVPPETDVVATTSASLSVSRIHGDVSLTSAWGRVGADDLTGDLRLRSETGDIDAGGLRGGTVDAETGTGTVRISFDTPPSDVRAAVRASGDIGMDLPEGVYDVVVSAPRTDVESRVDPSSSRKVRATTPDGGIHICC